MIHNRDWTPINQSIHFTLAKVVSLLRLFVALTSFCSIYQLPPQLSSVPMLESGILTSPRNLSMPLLPQSHAHCQREYIAMSEFSRWNYKLVTEKPEKEHYYPNLEICYGALLIRVWLQLCVKKEYETKKKLKNHLSQLKIHISNFITATMLVSDDISSQKDSKISMNPLILCNKLEAIN